MLPNIIASPCGLFQESNQALIMSKGGSRLLASTASRTDDLQTLRMVAGAIANLCGNGKTQGNLAIIFLELRGNEFSMLMHMPDT